MGLSIETSDPKNEHADLWCNGCGKHVVIRSANWAIVLARVEELGWITVPFDYGWGEGYEHFCCTDCLDPPEWED